MTTEANKKAKGNKKKNDMILLGVLALIGIIIGAVFWIQTQDRAQAGNGDPVYYVQVDVNNRTEALIALNKEGDYTFHNLYSEGENTIHIADGGISMQSANCPDQVCVYQGIIEPPTIIPIVCMPNVVYVSLIEQSEIDWSKIRAEMVPEELQEAYEAFRQAQ